MQPESMSIALRDTTGGVPAELSPVRATQPGDRKTSLIRGKDGRGRRGSPLVTGELEATTGFEPVNRGFAVYPVASAEVRRR
jgi:hypothetical protein